MATRLIDIAEKAGVSLTTASHVMRGYTKSKIKRETWDHVLKVADELGYRPNAIARSLKIQRINTIGLYTGYGYHSLRDPFLAEVYTGIQRVCSDLHYDFLVHVDIEGKEPNEIRLRLNDGKVAGLVVYAQSGDAVVAELARTRMPAVAIADRQELLPSLIADDADGMRQLADYLWSRGHRDIAYLTSHVKLASVEARSETIARLIAERGGRCTVLPFPQMNPGEFLAQWRVSEDRPTALCCWNDYYAYQMVRAGLDLGLRIPDDLAIVGFDGLLDTLLPARNLVTIRVPWEDMAAEAAKMLLRLLDGETLPSITTFPVTLVAGDTA
ncbi:MAG: LacI family DNA-binding transcriptional regulator [Capsulimonas sp.]|uniref:LacI family DNA-binding transcriptional regulator n=1 Tax=Capsulimonas sp. TaxID=2494211 RepID=UPI003264ABB8